MSETSNRAAAGHTWSEMSQDVLQTAHRRYRSRFVIVFGCCLGVIFGLAALGYAAGSPDDAPAGLRVFGWVMLAIFLWVFGVRNLRAGVYPKERGILVRNHFRTYEVPWEEIDKFVLAPHGLTPAMGHVVLRSSKKRAISSIVASSVEILSPKLHPTSNLLDELNDLAKRMNRSEPLDERDG